MLEEAKHSGSSQTRIYSPTNARKESKYVKWDRDIANALKQPVTIFGFAERERLNGITRQKGESELHSRYVANTLHFTKAATMSRYLNFRRESTKIDWRESESNSLNKHKRELTFMSSGASYFNMYWIWICVVCRFCERFRNRINL